MIFLSFVSLLLIILLVTCSKKKKVIPPPQIEPSQLIEKSQPTIVSTPVVDKKSLPPSKNLSEIRPPGEVKKPLVRAQRHSEKNVKTPKNQPDKKTDKETVIKKISIKEQVLDSKLNEKKRAGIDDLLKGIGVFNWGCDCDEPACPCECTEVYKATKTYIKMHLETSVFYQIAQQKKPMIHQFPLFDDRKTKAVAFEYELPISETRKSILGLIHLGDGNATPEILGGKRRFLDGLTDDSDGRKRSSQEKSAKPRHKLSSTDLPKRGVASKELINNWEKYPPILLEMEYTDIESSADGASSAQKLNKRRRNGDGMNDEKLEKNFYNFKPHYPYFCELKKKIEWVHRSKVAKEIISTETMWLDYDWDNFADSIDINFENITYEFYEESYRERRTPCHAYAYAAAVRSEDSELEDANERMWTG